MIRRDFLSKGFPICKTNPVLCFIPGTELKVAYNHGELRDILSTYNVSQCVGIWPGKWNTDVFPLEPESYKKFCPPVKHQNIVDALQITINRRNDGSFQDIIYKIEDDSGHEYDVVSHEPELYEYISKAGLKFRTRYV